MQIIMKWWAGGKNKEGTRNTILHTEIISTVSLFCRFEVSSSGGLGTCFGEPPFPLPLSGGDEDLYSPSCRTTIDGNSEPSPTFEKLMVHEMEKTVEDSRFIAQHVRNKDSFENVSKTTKEKYLSEIFK